MGRVLVSVCVLIAVVLHSGYGLPLTKETTKDAKPAAAAPAKPAVPAKPAEVKPAAPAKPVPEVKPVPAPPAAQEAAPEVKAKLVPQAPKAVPSAKKETIDIVSDLKDMDRELPTEGVGKKEIEEVKLPSEKPDKTPLPNDDDKLEVADVDTANPAPITAKQNEEEKRDPEDDVGVIESDPAEDTYGADTDEDVDPDDDVTNDDDQSDDDDAADMEKASETDAEAENMEKESQEASTKTQEAKPAAAKTA